MTNNKMRYEEFRDGIWDHFNHARSRLEKARSGATEVDDTLYQLADQALDIVMKAQARCAKLTKIGIKK